MLRTVELDTWKRFRGTPVLPSQSQQLPLSARVYIAVVGLVGITGAVECFNEWAPHMDARFIVYLLICVASSGMRVSLPGINGSISVNYVFTLLAVLEFTPPETLFLALLSAATQTFWHAKQPPRPVHLFFNLSCITLMVLAAEFVYHLPWFTGAPEGHILRLALAGMVYFVVNTLTVSIVIALTEGRSIQTIWRDFYNWSFSYYLAGVSVAEIVHVSIAKLGWGLTVALVPLIYMIFRSYKLYMGRMEQDKEHAESMAALHLRTIEALAMAIEAKDECTHEHLRRVQVYSLKTAEHLGLGREEIRALEAASILHDIGKLAVPDHIISKPGKLTPEEFDKMKIHTVVGAAILEQVGFPFAVPPIVRSHHEKWDGSGYPDGLKAEEIPIGARILSAVDCLDAMASDRQYRRALPLDEAMEYVASLSGRSFDPQVIDILKSHYREFERLAQSAPKREGLLDRKLVVSRGEAPDAGFQNDQPSSINSPVEHARNFVERVASARHEVTTIVELAQDLNGFLGVEEMLSMVAQRLKQLVAFDCIAVWVREGDVLRPKYVNGEGSRMFASLEIPLGQGLSGWVVENRKPIVNGNPSVEPGQAVDAAKFSSLNSALSIPFAGEHLCGALTLYRAERDAYTKDHLRILQAVNGKISRAIESAMGLRHSPRHASADQLTGLRNARSIYLHLQEEISRCEVQNKRLAVMICDLDGLKSVNDCSGHFTGDELLKRVARIITENCRDTDAVGRMGGDEFMAVLAGAGSEELESRINVIDRLTRIASREICGQEVGVSVGIACFPDDGMDSESLVSYADDEMYRAKRMRKNGAKQVLRLPRSVQVA